MCALFKSDGGSDFCDDPVSLSRGLVVDGGMSPRTPATRISGALQDSPEWTGSPDKPQPPKCTRKPAILIKDTGIKYRSHATLLINSRVLAFLHSLFLELNSLCPSGILRLLSRVSCYSGHLGQTRCVSAGLPP